MLFKRLSLRSSQDRARDIDGPDVDPAAPPLGISREDIDFGEVSVRDLETEALSVANNSLGVILTALISPRDSDFSLPGGDKSHTILIDPGESKDVPITFHPVAEGTNTARLTIFNALMEPMGVVILHGTGTPPPPCPEVDELLEFFDEATEAARLEGRGSARSAGGRLAALRSMIESAGHLVEAGDPIDACEQLRDAHGRTNGNETPVDLVQGPAAAELAERIGELVEKGFTKHPSADINSIETPPKAPPAPPAKKRKSHRRSKH